ncbi:tRNA (adenosine(37)-N6)-threonylcarbamoyltransferase complex dimerization subunit type 1 TsaB [Buchnera aphidicola]|uniref:tRNA threonylcarbamoyladenosine biosynthesis protein TsaB n=1 Tax=Buchnera aphidicola subsp. Rhopalosiphum maidis TaxID=118109 RepID=A0A3G2I5N4_BUCRM|nr:tRNA (adenosine(37)-N6)-threonylcarbamoyltransferase complex dimerization subunit type 1 TsaB [Buchnera aphidicola]AYN24742.1 tRNA (adenosine(37)-N6)-threonylcarbamoyltransferase complex dimerization subunit type 1 TsaB [Buchnera aphidicola (Rhopalosiphum maidis)]
MSDIILAIDTSIDYCSVAIYKKKIIYSLSENCKKEHTKKILPMIQKVLINAKITLKDLNYVAFSKGPGKFTGIRIAIGIAQSLSLSLKIPIFGISTLSILAEQAWRKYKKKKILVAIYAKIGEVYWGRYIKNDSLLWTGEHTESLVKINEIEKKIKTFQKKWTLVGNGWEKIKWENTLKFEKKEMLHPNAKDIIPFCLLKIKNQEFLHRTKTSNNYLDNLF